MADFESFGGFDSAREGASSGAEVSQEALERFQEQARRTAAQAKQDQKQERQKKQQDNALARIIVQFLQNPRFSGFFVVISRALSKNIPSDFLLAILSLIHKEAFDEITKKELPTADLSENFTAKFPPQFSLPLQQWNLMMVSVATAEPQAGLESMVDEAWEVDMNTIQLISLVLREYFSFQKFEVPFENISQFSKTFVASLIKKLENQVINQQLLTESVG